MSATMVSKAAAACPATVVSRARSPAAAAAPSRRLAVSALRANSAKSAATSAPATHASANSSSKALQQLKASEGAVSRYAAEKKSSIISIGLTIHNAPVELREKLAVAQAEWPRAIEELCAYPHIEEAGVLSTCNRMELYCVGLSWHRGVREIEEWMSKSSGVPVEELRPYLFLLRDRDATHHLMRVSGGLDSLVMGEGQILAQVKAVYQVGQDVPGFGRQLNGLFKQAITAGKRVRAETSISSGAVSVSAAAAELALLKLPGNTFEGVNVCIIGAGTMSTLLVKHLASKGCKRVTILNRSYPRAEALAADFPDVTMEIHLMDKLMEATEAADLVFAASGSETLLLEKVDIAGMAPCGVADGQRRFVDISVPRNIAHDINEVDGAVVYNVDDLKEVVQANKAARRQAAMEAEALLMEEIAAFESWRDSLETVPTIKALRSKAEDIRTAELEKAMKSMGEGLTKKQKKALEELSRGIMNKLLHGPMTALRCDGSDPAAVSETLENMAALERMYSLAELKDAPKAGKR